MHFQYNNSIFLNKTKTTPSLIARGCFRMVILYLLSAFRISKRPTI